MATLKVPVKPADHSQGPAGALVTLVEYGDYECSHCGHAYRARFHFTYAQNNVLALFTVFFSSTRVPNKATYLQ